MCLHLVSGVAPNDANYGLITTSYLGSLCFEYSVKEQGNVVAVNLVAILFRSNHTLLEGKMSLTTGGTIDQSSSLHLKSFSFSAAKLHHQRLLSLRFECCIILLSKNYPNPVTHKQLQSNST